MISEILSEAILLIENYERDCRVYRDDDNTKALDKVLCMMKAFQTYLDTDPTPENEERLESLLLTIGAVDVRMVRNSLRPIESGNKIHDSEKALSTEIQEGESYSGIYGPKSEEELSQAKEVCKPFKSHKCFNLFGRVEYRTDLNAWYYTSAGGTWSHKVGKCPVCHQTLPT